MKFILMGLLRQFRKNYGREPSFDELRTLGNQAKEIEQLDRGQVIPFPETRITDPFTPRPEPTRVSQLQTPPLPSTPAPIVSGTQTANVVNPLSGLTQTETALLSPEEQLIRQRIKRV
jgi:hypothetical protein